MANMGITSFGHAIMLLKDTTAELKKKKEELERQEAYRYAATMSDNFYYTSGRERIDREHIRDLKNSIKELEATADLVHDEMLRLAD